MIPLINLKEYTNSDPLDKLSKRKGLYIHMGVVLVFTIILFFQHGFR